MDLVINNLLEADKALQKASHLFYVTFPLIKNKNLLIKIVLESRNTVMHIITAILQYEHIHKRINLSQDPKLNFKIFEETCAPRYNITAKELEQIKELFHLTKKHEESSMEVMKNEKVIIFSKDLNQNIIDPEKVRNFVDMSKNIFKKTKETIIKDRKT